MAPSEHPLEISVQDAQQLRQNSPATVELIDVREPFEREICAVEGSRHIPMRQIPEQLADLPRDRPLLILCHHGGRSLRVTQYLRAQGFDQATNIVGGIEAWAQEIQPGMPRY